MAKASINVCDHCGAWDSETVPVVKVGVAGVNFQLCPTRRQELLVAMGVDEQNAQRYVTVYDIRKNHPEIKLSLSGLDRIWNDLFPEPASKAEEADPDYRDPSTNGEPAGDGAQGDSDAVAGGDDGEQSGVDTEVAATRSRARKR